MSVHRLPEPDNNPRLVPFLPAIDPNGERYVTTKRDFVEPLPVGSYVAMVFRITDYDADCDGSAMVRAEQVDRHGEPTGWEIDSIGLYESTDVVLDGPGDLHDLIT